MLLTIAATPIGHLSDASFRLIETLKSADIIAAEDTRVTLKLCQHYDISTPLIRWDKEKEGRSTKGLLSLLEEGKHVVLVSDAGTPCVSDPGALTVQAAVEAGYAVETIPGPSAVTTMLSLSGFPQTSHHFLGFLPKTKKALLDLLTPFVSLGGIIVTFETSKRIEKTLDILEAWGMVEQMVCGRELTKKFQTVSRGTVQEVKTQIQETPIKGEWCMAFILKQERTDIDEAKLSLLLKEGFTKKDVLKIGKVFGWGRNDVYRFLQEES